MRKSFRTLGAAGALLCLASAMAAAQNNSDHIGTITTTSPVTGVYSPGLGGGGGPGGPAFTPAAVSGEERALVGGSASQRAVGAALSGGSTTALGNSLTSAGAPAAQVNLLMSALTNLGANPSAASLQAAIQAYNALINAAPAGFINNPPANISAIRAALVAIRSGV